MKQCSQRTQCVCLSVLFFIRCFHIPKATSVEKCSVFNDGGDEETLVNAA